MADDSFQGLGPVQITGWTALGKTVCTAAAALVALVAMSGCSLLLDFGEAADAGPDNTGPDAYIVPSDKCMAYESYNEYASPYDLAPGTLDAAICPGVDKDYYQFVLAQDAQVTINVTFAHAVADLGLELYRTSDFRPELYPVATVDTQDDNETLTEQLTADTYIFQVYSNQQGENIYSLELLVQ